MNHILYILPYLNLGGTEKHALSLVRYFKGRYHVSLLAPEGNGDAPFKAANINYHSFTSLDQNIWQGLREFKSEIKKIHSDRPIDLVHVHAGHELMLLVKLFLPRQIPILFTAHGYHGAGTMISYRLAALFSNWVADAAIAVCESEKQILLDMGLQSQKLHLIYNGVSTPEVDLQKSMDYAHKFNLEPKSQIILGTAARLNPVKGLTYLIAAFGQLLPDSNLRLVIAGVGELEQELKQQTVDLNIENQVVFAGYIHDLPNLLNLFDIFVLPSLQEACSLACAEAMAQQKVVVGTNVGGISEQVIDAQTGFIVPPQNVDILVNRLKILIEDHELRIKLAASGYARYQKYFKLEGMLEQTAKLCDRLIN
jgi:L-malate glycosyltransferase